MFELVEETLDPIALAIEFLVKGRFARAAIQDGRLQHVVGGETFVEAFKLLAVVRLARGEVQGDGAVFIQGGGVDFGA